MQNYDEATVKSCEASSGSSERREAKQQSENERRETQALELDTFRYMSGSAIE
jgi:hypothetical protein